MTQPTKRCATCEAEKPITAFISKHRSCRDCAEKARLRRAAEKPEAKEKRVARPPVEYTPELGQHVCDLVAEGEALVDICNKPGFPSARDIARWRVQHEEFALVLAAARDTRADVRADTIHGYVREMKAGSLDPQTGKACIDALRWLAAKDSPRYADKVVTDLTVRPGKAEADKPDTAAWLDKVLGPAIAAPSNVITLLPTPQSAAPAPITDEPDKPPALDPNRIRRFNPVTGRLEEIA